MHGRRLTILGADGHIGDINREPDKTHDVADGDERKPHPDPVRYIRENNNEDRYERGQCPLDSVPVHHEYTRTCEDIWRDSQQLGCRGVESKPIDDRSDMFEVSRNVRDGPS